MIVPDNKIIDSLKFVVNEIKKICLKRSHKEGFEKCNVLLLDIAKMENHISNEKRFTQNSLDEIKNEIVDLIDELRFIIQTEIRFILFPLPDIKKQAYEFGKKYMKNFLEWVKEEDDYTPERLLELLEDENYRLDEAKKILSKIKNRQKY